MRIREYLNHAVDVIILKEYDYLIVGSGLYGSVCAYELSKKGYDVLVLERRNHVGGNVYTKKVKGIPVHMYGAHVFHTDNKEIWDYVNSITEFVPFTAQLIALSKGKQYNLPFNMNTFYQLWGTETPDSVKRIMNEQKLNISNPKNLEEQVLSTVGIDIYETLIKEYTEKQWGKECKELPKEIIQRIPIRYTYDNNYFNDKYQGIPEEGYSPMIDIMLNDVDIKIKTDYLKNKKYWNSISSKIIYTGCIDEFYNYKFGHLEYRSLMFKHEIMKKDNYQGLALKNFIDKSIPYTRQIEHKHFHRTESEYTVITKEYPTEPNYKF